MTRLAEGLHIGHVMAGEQDGGAVALVVFGDEGADAALHGHIQADGGFIQEDHLRTVQQRRRDLALHALAERDCGLACQQRSQLEQPGQFIEGALEIRLGRR